MYLLIMGMFIGYVQAYILEEGLRLSSDTRLIRYALSFCSLSLIAYYLKGYKRTW